MKPHVNSIIQAKAPKEEFKENGKLYFFSKSYKTGYPCSKDIESSIFLQKIKQSVEIIIIDKFFDIKEIDKTAKIIKENNIADKKDFKFFKLYTKNTKEKQEAVNSMKRMLSDKFWVYEIQDNFIHDRFAILDKELFHFGGTVGGKASEGFSAFSCGWDANKIKPLLHCNEKYEWIM